ncbi:hypothetical protein SAMN05444671_4147 [Flavobacterium sp. CF108]|uniref:hypothetical protein n=1 Tax=unclassified Flavobacterium TaxID=196869 RepID=UPI0008C19CE8|nr:MULTISPECIES: hypothetical protein [unclassified Flavobacterium]SEO67888.1 hypothetical protein SAMN04487978_3401 [Flavobacterium sp. fv08]SHH89582.1 hypothetical protein SAMN05444671_4147 [Flavobacterium sp. CF108]
MDKLSIQRLKKTLLYLESKHRELKRQNDSDTRSIESMIKYLKKDMLEQFNLTDYDIYIKEEAKNTEIFIRSVKNIIDEHSSCGV